MIRNRCLPSTGRHSSMVSARTAEGSMTTQLFGWTYIAPCRKFWAEQKARSSLTAVVSSAAVTGTPPTAPQKDMQGDALESR